MKVQFRYNRKKLVWILIMAVFAIIMFVWARYPAPLIAAFTAAFAAVCGLEVELSDGTPGWWTRIAGTKAAKALKFPAKMTVVHNNMLSWIWTAVLMVAGPWFSVWCMQHIILAQELDAKTGKTAFRMNVLCVSILYLAMLCVFARTRWAFIVSHTIILIIAFADYFVYEFRQNEIVFADLDTIGTGISVAKNYRFQMSERGALLILATVLAFALVLTFKISFSICSSIAGR